MLAGRHPYLAFLDSMTTIRDPAVSVQTGEEQRRKRGARAQGLREQVRGRRPVAVTKYSSVLFPAHSALSKYLNRLSSLEVREQC